jgi:hypothetical protein
MARARLKLVSAADGALLLVRFVPFTEQVRRTLGRKLRSAAPTTTFDGEVYSVQGESAVAATIRLLRGECELAYDPNLLRGHPALPNPWPIPTVAARDWSQRRGVSMARVHHPELGESLAFQSAEYDDDFMIDFKLTLADAGRWYRFRQDLDRVPVWIVAEWYADRVHEVLDRYFDCCWDEFMAGEEWDVLPPPNETRYPVRRLSPLDFRALGVQPFADLHDINAAYRERKAAYLERRIPVEEWLDTDVAYQRIRRHHFPVEPSPEVLVAPREIVLLLRQRFPDDEADRARWFNGYNQPLGGVPATMIATTEGFEAVTRYLEVTLALAPRDADR